MPLTLLRHARVQPATPAGHIRNALLLLGALEQAVAIAQVSGTPYANQTSIAQGFSDLEDRLGDALDLLKAGR